MQDIKSKGRNWRRIRVLVVLPVAFVLWMVGWTLYCLGEPTQSERGSAEHK
ncbi:MAG: hypothetical protein WC325_07810 [Candidatus Bathyarchaeia archaeon]